jgi:hypothetical protein
MSANHSDTPKPHSAFVLAGCVLVLSFVEAGWLYNWHRSNEALYLANIRRASQNALDQRKIMDLRAAAVRINGLYLRFQDPITTEPQHPQQFPSLGGGLRQSGSEPIVVQDFLKAGFVAMPASERRPEASIVYELGSNQLELHRFVPLLAQEENSNAFLFLDHLELLRPKAIGPFSERPTALQARLTTRIFQPIPR